MPAAYQPLERVRNIGLIAHIDAGKTTTTERILYYAGRIHSLGSVDNGTTVTDWMEQEQERGISIVAAAVTAEWRKHRINLIDTPGHIDFTAEVQRSLRVLEGGVVVFDAVRGVEPQSETVWRQADRYRVPRVCFINKMDRIGADFDHALTMIQTRLGAAAVALQIPMGTEAHFEGVIDLITLKAIWWKDELGVHREFSEIPAPYLKAAAVARAQLIEKLAETDDQVLELYLSGKEPQPAQLCAALRRATIANRLFPVLCGAALRNRGVQPLLDAIVDYLPSPLDIGPVSGTDPLTGAQLKRSPDPEAPLAALVFKVSTDLYSGHLSYLRVYSGLLKSGDRVFNATRGQRARIGRLVRMYANRREDIDEIMAGDIAAALGLKGVFTGDTLCQEDNPILLESISFPEPVIHLAIEPRSVADEARMSSALTALAEEDPTFKVMTDDNTGQTIIAGMGELHLEVLLERMRREYGIAVRTGQPRVTYKETITQVVARAEGRYVRQTGGHGQYGHVVLELTPGERGSGLVFENALKGSAVPKEFIPAVEQGVREAAESGIIGGYTVTDLRVRFYEGSYHPVDSSELAFRLAAAQGLREGLRRGKSILLEPIFRLEVIIPQEYLGEIMGQLVARRSDITGIESGPGGVQIIHAQVPLAEMFGYATELRSATQGRGVFSMEFLHYAPLDPMFYRGLFRRG